MAQYTTLSDKDLEEILSVYHLGEVVHLKGLNGGQENTNYHLKTNKNEYVLTICEQKTPQEARDLAQLLRHLEGHDFRSSKIIVTNKKQSISIWNDKPVMIKDYLHGKIVDDLSDNLLILIGKEMAKLHQIEVPELLPKQLNYGIEHFHETMSYAPDSEFHEWLGMIKEFVQPYLTEYSRSAIIHSDIFCDNVIVSEDEQSIVLMDFEEAAHYYCLFDIGMAIIGLCQDGQKINLNKAKQLLKGYQEVESLSTKERHSLQAFTIYAGAAMTFWRHKNFNLTNPLPEKFDHYLGLKVLADYIKSIPEAQFKERVGLV